jgi:D-glycero-D-manno-heptose 1,7-bisphosphate phosphatase
VINIEKKSDYIRNRKEFIFYEGVKEHFFEMNKTFSRILIVTNQRGIGKGLMTHDDLQDIHVFLNEELNFYDGKVHHFFYAPDLESEAINRKPNIGMGLQAKEMFQDIDFSKSIMVGNNLSDMEFGKRLGMKTVFVETTKALSEQHEWVDIKLPSLLHFIQLL